MKHLEISSDNIDEAISVLKAGGVVAHPADTCYGLAADLMNEDALRKTQAIKGRDADKPMSVMLPSFLKPKLMDYGQMTELAQMICDKLFPGPVTIVLPKGPNIPEYFFPEQEFVGIRMPYDSMTEKLLMGFKGPLITTSANLSGEPAVATAEEVTESLKDREVQPDLILDGSIQGDCKPSTVLKVDGKEVVILREGPLSQGQLEGLLGIKVKKLT